MAINFDLSESQALLQTSIREFLERECPEALVRESEESDLGYSSQLWQKLADVGFLGLGIPEPYGGAGSTFFDLGLFFEEAGRVLMPGPHLSTLAIAAPAIAANGTEEQKQRLLQGITAGKVLFSFALAESDGEPSTPSDYPRGDSLPAPPEENRVISFPVKISQDWIDRMGHMGIEHYQLIFSQAHHGYLEALGYGIETLRERGLTVFALGSVTRYLREMKLGEPLIVKTQMLSLQSKTETYLHELWRAGDDPILCATFENTAAFVDRHTRRAVAVPVDFRQKSQSIHGIESRSTNQD